MKSKVKNNNLSMLWNVESYIAILYAPKCPLILAMHGSVTADN